MCWGHVVPWVSLGRSLGASWVSLEALGVALDGSWGILGSPWDSLGEA